MPGVKGFEAKTLYLKDYHVYFFNLVVCSPETAKTKSAICPIKPKGVN